MSEDTKTPDNEFFPDSELWMDALEQEDALIKIRGNIINEVIKLEYFIDEVILKAFYPLNNSSDNERKTWLKNFILDPPFMTTFEKWRLLRNILKNHEILKEKNYSTFLKDLKYIIEIRDDFAHGIISYREDEINPKTKKHQSYLDYYREGNQSRPLTNEFFDDLTKKLSTVTWTLDSISMDLIPETA